MLFSIEGSKLKGPNGFEHDLSWELTDFILGTEKINAEFLLGPAFEHYCRFVGKYWFEIRQMIHDEDTALQPTVDALIPSWCDKLGYALDAEGYLIKKP